MAIPDYQTVMLPALEAVADSTEHSVRDVIESVAERFKLTTNERAELLPSGRMPTYYNRTHWAISYLRHAGLFEATRRGWLRITPEGLRVLESKPSRIDNRFLEQYAAFREFRRPTLAAVERPPAGEMTDAETPEEGLERAWRGLRDQLAQDLLERLKVSSPRLFEEVVVRLLVKMGYGGTYKDAAQVVGRSGDGGIDGVINEDPLGLDAVYVQAKRWQNVVGGPVVREFAGSLDGKRARKGVLITTSTFSPDARAYVLGIEKRIVLIDGPRLVDLMIEHELGVVRQQEYRVHRIDADEFEET